MSTYFALGNCADTLLAEVAQVCVACDDKQKRHSADAAVCPDLPVRPTEQPRASLMRSGGGIKDGFKKE